MKRAGGLVAFIVLGCTATQPPATAPSPAPGDAGTGANGPEAAAPTAALADAAPPRGPFEITLSRSVCMGSCPSYKVTIRSDGTVVYDGDQYVGVHGKVTDHVTVEAARALADELDAASFETLHVTVPCSKGVVSDNPTAILTYVRDGRTIVVDHYHGNACAPKVLFRLEDHVDKVADTSRWIRCGTPPGHCDKP